jgi:hypothetical protein
MRSITRLFGLFASCLFCLPAIFAQTNPPPPDPHEMVTREPRILSKSADRSAAIDLLDRARKNYDLHSTSAPYALKVSFESNDATQNEGTGTMEELYDGHSHWRWTEELQDSHIVRIGADSRVYGDNPSEPVPLRVQLVRSVLLRSIVHDPASFEIRATNVERDGKTISCLLLSYSLPPNPAPRSWVEREDCLDPATGLLQTWSEAPGIYAVYDYTGATEFHGHTLPRQVSVFEDGRLALQVRLESLEDAPNLDPSLFKPTPEMVDEGESYALASPRRFPLRVDPSDAPTSRFFQPVIVHATLDAQDGTVLDAEALETADPDLSRSALEVVKSTSFEPSGFQQEVFINVQFHLPAVRLGGPPIFHSSPRWVILDHGGRIPPVKRLPHAGN